MTWEMLVWRKLNFNTPVASVTSREAMDAVIRLMTATPEPDAEFVLLRTWREGQRLNWDRTTFKIVDGVARGVDYTSRS